MLKLSDYKNVFKCLNDEPWVETITFQHYSTQVDVLNPLHEDSNHSLKLEKNSPIMEV